MQLHGQRRAVAHANVRRVDAEDGILRCARTVFIAEPLQQTPLRSVNRQHGRRGNAMRYSHLYKATVDTESQVKYVNIINISALFGYRAAPFSYVFR